MSAIDLSNPFLASTQLLDCYINQLFGNRGTREAVCENIEPHSWVAASSGSYQIWLTYAMVDIYASAGRLEVGGWVPTENTPGHVEFLRASPQDWVDRYYTWAFPGPQAQIWRAQFQDEARRIVSPIHFWFFVKCECSFPERPYFPTSTYQLFRHPLFFIADYREPPPLVVPEYFFRPGTIFDKIADATAASYCVFPYFGQRLFEYAELCATQPGIGTFTTFYAAREAIWFVPAGSTINGTFRDIHPMIRRHWRWEEVLEIFWGYRMPGKGNVQRPRWCQPAPPHYHENGLVSEYLESFARMATVWMKRRVANPGV